uniref:Uncharacterized protein n=1 Tax=viral metagenome TaxID=1070528 RepID=A0A6C0H5I0_9ZZZZ
MVRRKTLRKKYYKNRQKNIVKKTTHRRRATKRKRVGGAGTGDNVDIEKTTLYETSMKIKEIAGELENFPDRAPTIWNNMKTMTTMNKTFGNLFTEDILQKIDELPTTYDFNKAQVRGIMEHIKTVVENLLNGTLLDQRTYVALLLRESSTVHISGPLQSVALERFEESFQELQRVLKNLIS